jgi:hypothetical protein
MGKYRVFYEVRAEHFNNIQNSGFKELKPSALFDV